MTQLTDQQCEHVAFYISALEGYRSIQERAPGSITVEFFANDVEYWGAFLGFVPTDEVKERAARWRARPQAKEAG